MPVDRPTFSESWYRVCDLKPRVISTVQIHRQHFRGRTWHVVADPASNQFFRLNEAAYRFVAMLDGRRTVADVWKVCNEQLGDDAPTQPEAIQLLGQLYTSNLLAAELPPDAEGLFARYHQRITREIQGYLMNIMFARIPLFDPDHFLDRWIGVFGWLFSWVGLLFWLALMSVGGYFLLGRWDDMVAQTQSMIMHMEVMQQIGWLYLATAVIKVLHEFGHAFACKKFGRQTGTGGEVHQMGIMFLIFTPLPYVDASSSWAFRSKWHRMVVGLGGMYVELAVAAVAAVVWANTADATLPHTLAFYMIFIAGFSTVVFNANPLLRYDGYYILSDLLELPNLWQRSRQYTYYLVKKYVWGVRRPFNPAGGFGERVWLTIYGIASTLYRFVVCAAILFFIADRLFLLGAVLAIVAVVVWVFVPLGKFVHYLLTSPELMRVRGRAVITTLAVVALAVVGLGVIDVADHCTAEGPVSLANMTVVYAGEDGFLARDDNLGVAPGGRAAKGDTLLVMENPELLAQREQVQAQIDQAMVRRQAGLAEELSDVPEEKRQFPPSKTTDKEIASLRQSLATLDARLKELTPAAQFDGEWIPDKLDQKRGSYIKKGQPLGLLADRNRIVVRAVAKQDDAWLIEQARPAVELRVKDRPDLNGLWQSFSGRIDKILPAGQSELPSPAVGYAAGGSIPVNPKDPKGMTATEHVFEIQIVPDEGQDVQLLIGQRVVVRFTAEPKPLAFQWLRSGLQMVQKRFKI
jgi:putative peptide zinc metalloprotease protein